MIKKRISFDAFHSRKVNTKSEHKLLSHVITILRLDSLKSLVFHLLSKKINKAYQFLTNGDAGLGYSLYNDSHHKPQKNSFWKIYLNCHFAVKAEIRIIFLFSVKNYTLNLFLTNVFLSGKV